ncbi:MAG: hypothetical protein N2035_10170 [Chthoniobacterales bacterium]|nr:hypothetical protein [Chthoniobacterales bacterium]
MKGKRVEPIAVVVFGLVMVGFVLTGLRWGVAVYYSRQVNTEKLDVAGERYWLEKREEMLRELAAGKFEVKKGGQKP